VSLLGLGFALAIVSLCIQMITDTFLMRSIMLFLWILIAVAVSLAHLNQDPQNEQELMMGNFT